MATKIVQSLFDIKNLPDDAQKVLRDFDQIAQAAMPANSKQLVALPKIIRELSHQMTDDRGSRRLGYMNEKTFLASYVRYFMWWNLVRLARLFSNLDFGFLSGGGVCLDIGSGPLTLPCALWLARPDLRQKKLVWYVMDISQLALSLGEEIFLSVAAATGGEPWKIVRVKGPLGTAVKEKARFVTCANMFNELLQSRGGEPPDYLAKKYSQALFKYLDFESDRGAENFRDAKNCGGPANEVRAASEGSAANDRSCPAVFLAEPGTPNSARFVSLMRDAFIRRGLFALAPCPHQQSCPMDGRRAGKGGANGKWCNFAFDTDDAPKKLLALSAKAGIPKERAVISFVLASAEIACKPKNCGGLSGLEKVAATDTACAAREAQASPRSGGLLRVASDIIRLPPEREGQKPRVGHYACSEQGLVLALSKGGKRVYSGDLLEVENDFTPKSGAETIGKSKAAARFSREKVLASPKSGRRSPSQERDLGLRGRSSSHERDSRPRRDAKTGALIVEI
ncbi:MAG: small ribosomal subunit Rsm22 family protein [Treponema sp.]|nr:small ribosomal subunit Rsm22 family protein [Treponema sp.]MEE3433990.1 small ribosomal subunit Rsm22 family protein [Treponema sp.]